MLITKIEHNEKLSFDIVIIIIVLVHSQAQGQRSFLG
jgi:hypothetical protein